MTQTCEPTTAMTPTRRRAHAAPPVLISIPNLSAATRGPRPRPRRRRLRREFRVAGYALLAILPTTMAFVTLGGGRPSPPLPVQAAETAPGRGPVISLAPLEPVVVVRRDLDGPVSLPGYLLPADTPEESSDGAH